MGSNSKSLRLVFLITLFVVLGNYFLFPKLILVQVFAAIYLVVIYKYFSRSLKEFLYFSTLIFAIINYSLVIPVGGGFELYYFYISLFVYMVMTFIIAVRERNVSEILKEYLKFFKSNKYFRFTVIFFAYMLVGLMFVQSIRFALRILIVYFIMAPFIYMVYKQNNSVDSIKKTVRFLAIIFLGVVILGILEVLGFRYGVRTNYSSMGIDVLQYPYFKRIPIVFFYNQNNFGMFLVMGMTMIIGGYFKADTRKQKLLYIAVYILAQINLIYTTSRISWIVIGMVSFFVFFLGLVFKDKKFRRLGYKFILITLVTFFTISLLPGSELYYGKFSGTPLLKLVNINLFKNRPPQINKQVIPQIGGEGSDNIRATIMYDIAKGVFVKGNYLGFGVGNTMYYLSTLNNTHGFTNPHSMWFEILGDFGIGIFAYFGYIYFSIINKLSNILKRSNGYTKMIALSLLISAFGFILLSFAPSTVVAFTPFWMLIGLATTFVSNYKEGTK